MHVGGSKKLKLIFIWLIEAQSIVSHMEYEVNNLRLFRKRGTIRLLEKNLFSFIIDHLSYKWFSKWIIIILTYITVGVKM